MNSARVKTVTRAGHRVVRVGESYYKLVPVPAQTCRECGRLFPQVDKRQRLCCELHANRHLARGGRADPMTTQEDGR